MRSFDGNVFYDSIRDSLFDGRLSSVQVTGLTAMIDRWSREAVVTDMRKLAYVLATAHHETGRAMAPIRELGGEAYLRRMYDVSGERPRLARANGNTTPGDGARFAGRGFVQITWKNNYARVGEKLGIDLVSDPDRALDLGVATEILVRGMVEGWFTGRKLADYFTAGRAEWRNARRIVNGLDQAALIAGYAQTYFRALEAASSVSGLAPPPRAPIAPRRAPSPPQPRPARSRRTPTAQAR
ncbi:MAG: glycoside hydrolase family 19 protein [Beijerinckiaceae bacterium]